MTNADKAHEIVNVVDNALTVRGISIDTMAWHVHRAMTAAILDEVDARDRRGLAALTARVEVLEGQANADLAEVREAIEGVRASKPDSATCPTCGASMGGWSVCGNPECDSARARSKPAASKAPGAELPLLSEWTLDRHEGWFRFAGEGDERAWANVAGEWLVWDDRGNVVAGKDQTEADFEAAKSAADLAAAQWYRLPAPGRLPVPDRGEMPRAPGGGAERDPSEIEAWLFEATGKIAYERDMALRVKWSGDIVRAILARWPSPATGTESGVQAERVQEAIDAIVALASPVAPAASGEEVALATALRAEAAKPAPTWNFEPKHDSSTCLDCQEWKARKHPLQHSCDEWYREYHAYQRAYAEATTRWATRTNLASEILDAALRTAQPSAPTPPSAGEGGEG